MNNPREIWKIFRQLVPKKPPPTSFGAEVDHERATQLNKFFAEIGYKTAETAARTYRSEPAVVAIHVPQHQTEFSFNAIGIDEFNKIVQKLPLFKSPGFDGINGYVIKISWPFIRSIFRDIANASLKNNTFPAVWKPALVIPLHKSGDTETPGNFRPISLLSLFGKIIERIAFEQLSPTWNPN